MDSGEGRCCGIAMQSPTVLTMTRIRLMGGWMSELGEMCIVL